MNAYSFLYSIGIIAILLTELLFVIIILLFPLETGQIAYDGDSKWPIGIERYVDQHARSLQ